MERPGYRDQSAGWRIPARRLRPCISADHCGLVPVHKIKDLSVDLNPSASMVFTRACIHRLHTEHFPLIDYLEHLFAFGHMKAVAVVFLPAGINLGIAN